MGLQAFHNGRYRFCRRAKAFFFFFLMLFIALTYQQICLSFSRLNPNCRNTFRFQHTRLITLASAVTLFLNFVHICLCQKERKRRTNKQTNKQTFANKEKEEKSCLQGCLLFILLFIEENCSKAHGYCSYCKLLNRQHLIDVF